MSSAQDQDKILIITVHGVNSVNGGKHTMDRLADCFFKTGKFDIWKLRYGFLTAYQAQFHNLELATELANYIKGQKQRHTIFCIGHSNGCAIMHLASGILQVENVKLPNLTYTYLNPALDDSYAPSSIVNKTFVFFTESDNAVYVSWLLNVITPDSIDKYRPWGVMGKSGYSGKVKSVYNIPYESISLQDTSLNDLGHSGIFKIKNLHLFRDFLINKLLGIV